MSFSLTNFTDLCKLAIQYKASDIHLRSGEAPLLRIKGELIPVQSKTLDSSNIIEICDILFKNNEIMNHFERITEHDGSFEIENLCRIRYNFFKFSGNYGLIIRLISKEIPSIEDLKLPSILAEIVKAKHGLILVTGPTGCGKSTTLASMIQQINSTQSSHIITIEDPIEYIHPQLKSRISQREIGDDTENFTTGLRSALRQDPDVILIGEMRDPETISTALKAAETGHLVMSTLHTTNSIATINRIIAMFKTEQQADVKKRLAETLVATIGQRLLKSQNKNQMVLAQEIMISNPGVKECIVGKEDIHQITHIIERGYNQKNNKSQSFDQSIQRLFKKGLISQETAEKEFSSKSDFLQKMIVE